MTGDGPPYRRVRVIILSLIALAGLLRGGYWAVTTEVFSPVDEVQHLDYVADLAEGRGLPVAGEDTIRPALLELLKNARTSPWREAPGGAAPTPEAFGVAGQQYEGAQPPLYYALAAPAWLVGGSFGVRPGLYAVRFAGVLLSLLAIPALYLLSRELFPRHAVAALAAPGLLVFVQGFNGNLATVNNDALVPAAGVLALLPAARAYRHGFDRRTAVWTGLLSAAAVLVKTHTIVVVLLTLLVLLAGLARRRVTVSGAARWLGIAAGVGAGVLAPWIAWNLVQYGAPTGASVVHDLIMGPLQPPLSGTVGEVLRGHAERAASGFWAGQLLPLAADHPYQRVPFLVLLGGGALATTVAWRRRRCDEAIAAGLATLAVPVMFVGLLVVVFTALQGAGITVGRLLYPVLGLAVLAITASLVMLLGHRVGLAAVAVFVTVLLAWEAPASQQYVDAVYTRGIVDGHLVPVVEQSWNGRWADPEPIEVAVPDCEVGAVSLVHESEPPASLPVVVDGEPLDADLGASRPQFAGGFDAAYRLPRSPTRSLELVPDVAVGWSPIEREPAFQAASAGDPVAALHCPADDPRATRFGQLFTPDHPDTGYTFHVAWPRVWLALAALGALGAVGAAAAPAVRSRAGRWRGPR